MHAELDYYRRWPDRYAATARKVDICLAVCARRCTGNGCDEGKHCGRHERAANVAARYAALVERWRRHA
jgi:hypothetical protein